MMVQVPGVAHERAIHATNNLLTGVTSVTFLSTVARSGRASTVGWRGLCAMRYQELLAPILSLGVLLCAQTRQ